jgi:hypothetical protein
LGVLGRPEKMDDARVYRAHVFVVDVLKVHTKDTDAGARAFFQGLRKKVFGMTRIAWILIAIAIFASSCVTRYGGESFLGFQDYGEFGALTPVATGAPGSRPTWDNMLPTTYPLVPGYTGTIKPEPEMLSVAAKDGSRCWCPRAHPFDFRDTQRDTVCAKSTGQAFSNACTARCLGFKDEELYKCKPRMALYRVG